MARIPGTDDQPAPTPGDGRAVHDLVVQDILARKALGLRRYGTTLQAGNGRDGLVDAYQEALDLCCYLRQVLAEGDLEANLAQAQTPPADTQVLEIARRMELAARTVGDAEQWVFGVRAREVRLLCAWVRARVGHDVEKQKPPTTPEAMDGF